MRIYVFLYDNWQVIKVRAQSETLAWAQLPIDPGRVELLKSYLLDGPWLLKGPWQLL